MNVLLIQPPLTLLSHEIYSVVPPLGLAYIGAVLENAGHKVEIIDSVALNWKSPLRIGDKIHIGLKWDDIGLYIKRSKPDVVGVSCSFSSQSHNAHRVAQLAKAYDDEVPVIFGGAHPSALPESVLKDRNVDYVVIGEGEATTLDLLRSVKEGASLRKIDGCAYKEGPEIKVNPRRQFIQDLDSLPLPAHHLLPMKKYFDAKSSHGPELMRTPFTSMITSRGCPFNCVFCSIHAIWGHRWRPRSPENVLLEIEHLVDTYGIRELHFEDDNLTLDRKRIEKICGMILERGLDIKWTTPNGVAIWTLDKPLLQMMRKSGCYKLCFGIESGDADTLKFIRKPIKLLQAEKVIKWANEVGIWTHGFFVIGFPYESKEAIDRTLNFAVKSDLDFASFFIATPYPGTDLLNTVKKEGMINDHVNFGDLRVSEAAVRTKHFTNEQLNSLQREMYISFFKRRISAYLEPRKLVSRLKRISSTDDIVFLSRLLSRFTKIVKKDHSHESA